MTSGYPWHEPSFHQYCAIVLTVVVDRLAGAAWRTTTERELASRFACMVHAPVNNTSPLPVTRIASIRSDIRWIFMRVSSVHAVGSRTCGECGGAPRIQCAPPPGGLRGFSVLADPCHGRRMPHRLQGARYPSVLTIPSLP